MPPPPDLAAPENFPFRRYRFCEDAWAEGLRAWCAAASRAALDGTPHWLVVAQRGQVRWIKRRALQENLTLFGIRFLEAGMLRRALCELLSVNALVVERDALEFLLKMTAAARPEAEATAVARNAGACLRAMEELAAAGWSEADLDVPPPLARALFQALRRTGAWTPEIDRRLIKAASTQPLRSAVVGWDAGHFADLDLLEALARHSASCALFLPEPRSVSEGLQQSWIEAVEARWPQSSTPCDASGFASPHEPLVARLEGADLGGAVRPPQWLIGRDWRDQIQLVRDDVLTWLAATPEDQRAALIVPRRSPTSVALTRALAQAGIELLDETGEKNAAALDVLIQAQIARYHLLGSDVETLLGLIHLLREKSPADWSHFTPEEIHTRLDRAFSTMQSRNARLLAAGHEERGGAWPKIRALIEHLGQWEGAPTWREARAQWDATLQTLGLNSAALEPRWSQVETLLGATKIPAHNFLEYLAGALSARNSQRPAEAAAPHARVIITTLANALHQTWDRLIFLEANEGVWPLKSEENPFLDDAARRPLNQRRGHLLTTGEQSALEQARFLDLVEHNTGELVFAAAARQSGEVSRDAFPNEWVIRCLVESHGGDPQPALAEWARRVESCARANEKLPADELQHLRAVHASRHDPAVPFDRYLFNFGATALTPAAWSAAKLDEAMTCPATFALREIFRAESLRESAWTRAEGGVIGSRTHEWLARALGGTEELQPLGSDDYAARLEEAIAGTVQELSEAYARENLPLPIWWETCLRKAAWVARRCLAPVTQWAGHWFYAMEKRVRQEVTTGAGDLRLQGRYDLILSDRPELSGAPVRIIDFKTGKTGPPSLATLAQGSGFQFAAYFLMAKDAGAASVSVGVIRPGEIKLEAFRDADETALRAAMEPLAKLQRDLNFGRRGALVAEYGRCEILPMATLPIAPQILEQKAALSYSEKCACNGNDRDDEPTCAV